VVVEKDSAARSGATTIPYRPGRKHQLMCAGVTAKSLDCFFPPTPESVVFCLDKGLR